MLMVTEFSVQRAKPRLHGLDYLRGLSAFGIMIYHYSSWTFGEIESSSFLGRLGIYGVAIFYIVSGTALSHTYGSNLELTGTHLRAFYQKRLFRIFPLLWLATVASIILSKQLPNMVDLFLNLSGLFGLFKWNVYFATGAWSIGNELAFYAVFPLLIFLINKCRGGLALFVALSNFIFFYFAFYAFQSTVPLSKQWYLYTNPLNQLPFFLGGVLMGKYIKSASSKPWNKLVIGFSSLLLFSFFPVHGTAIDLVSGLNRLFFSACCFLICYSFYTQDSAHHLVDLPLRLLGQASYSLYLLHPLIFAVTKVGFALLSKSGLNVSTTFVLLTSTLLSLLVSFLSYRYFERRFIRIGNSFIRPQHND